MSDMSDMSNIEERARYAERARLRENGVIVCYYCDAPAEHWMPGYPEDGDGCLPLCQRHLDKAITHSRRQLDEIRKYGEAVTIRESRQEDDDRVEDITRLRGEIRDGLHPGWQILPNGWHGIVVYNWPDDLNPPGFAGHADG